MVKKLFVFIIFVLVLSACQSSQALVDKAVQETITAKENYSSDSGDNNSKPILDDQTSTPDDTSNRKTSELDEKLFGKWEYSYNKNGYDAFFYDVEFLEDGTFLIPETPYLISNTFTYSNPENGKIKFVSGAFIEVVDYGINKNELTLFFNDGYNIYQREGTEQDYSSIIISEPRIKYTDEFIGGNLYPTDERDFYLTTSDEILFINTNTLSIKLLKSFDFSNHVSYHTGVVSPDGRNFAGGLSDVVMFDIKTGRELYSVKAIANFLEFSQDSKIFATLEKENQIITIRSVENGSALKVIDAGNKYLEQSDVLAFSPNGKFLVEGVHYNRVILWDVNTGGMVNSFQTSKEDMMYFTNHGYQYHYMYIPKFSPDGEIIVVYSSNGKIYFFDKTLTLKNTSEGGFQPSRGNDLVFSPNGKLLAVPCQEGYICLLDSQNGKLIQKIITNEYYHVGDIAFSNDGSLLIALGSTTYIGPSIEGSNMLFVAEISPEYASGSLKQSNSVSKIDLSNSNESAGQSTQTSVSNCPGSPVQRLKVGIKGTVCTKKDSMRLRKEPGKSGEVIASLKPGTTFKVVGGPECAGSNWSWWKIELDSKQVGWLAEGGDAVDPYFLCPLN